MYSDVNRPSEDELKEMKEWLGKELDRLIERN